MSFARVFDEQVKRYGKTEKAVQETIRICKDRNVLKEYLVKEEVPEIMFANLTEEEQKEYVYRQGRVEGREEEKLSSIRNLMETMKLTTQQAMDALKISASDQLHYLSLL